MTRQWLSPPELMCKKHLLGEHLETHIFVSKMEKGWSLEGFIKGSMFFGADFIKQRHDQIVKLLENHTTPLEIGHLNQERYPLLDITESDMVKSVSDLVSRCSRCKEKHEAFLDYMRGREMMVTKSEDGI